jgi:hypothetical protein
MKGGIPVGLHFSMVDERIKSDSLPNQYRNQDHDVRERKMRRRKKEEEANDLPRVAVRRMIKEVRPKYQISKLMVGGASVCRSKK